MIKNARATSELILLFSLTLTIRKLHLVCKYEVEEDRNVFIYDCLTMFNIYRVYDTLRKQKQQNNTNLFYRN